jgi:hypothetical protein
MIQLRMKLLQLKCMVALVLPSEIVNVLPLVLGRQLIMMMHQLVRDMKGGRAVRTWKCANQPIFLAVRHHRMNHLLAELQVQLAVVEELNRWLGAQWIGMPIVIEMVRVIILTAHLHILMQIEWVPARLVEELPHLLGIEEVGILLEEMKAL